MHRTAYEKHGRVRNGTPANLSTTQQSKHDDHEYPVSDLQPNQHVRRVDLEGGRGHNRATHIHQGMEKIAQEGRLLLECDDQRRALEALIRKIKERNDTRTESARR